MAILPRYKRLRRRDWKDPFSWFNWYHQNKRDPVFLYRPESGRTGMIGFTNTRADSTTCARYRDSSGIWQVVAANVLRDNHYVYDPNDINGNVRTTLREGAGTNSALGSCSFADGTYWNGAAGFTLAAATSGFAGQTATKHTGGGVDNKYRYQQVGTFVNGQTDCFAIEVENDPANAATVTTFRIRDETAGADVHQVVLTWATKSVATSVGTGTSGVIDLGTGPNGGARLRIYLTATGTAAGTGAAGNQRWINFFPTGYTGNTKSVIVHHAQFEAATSQPSSPIVTVAGAVTRAADLISVAWPYAPQAMTVYVDCYDLMGDTAAAVTPTALQISNAAGATAYDAMYKATGKWRNRAVMAAGASDSTAATTATYGQRVELRAFLAVSGSNVTSNLGQSINSAAEAVAAAGTSRAIDAAWSTPTFLYIGASSTGGSQTNLAIRSIAIVLGSEQTMAQMRHIVRQ